ncbi:MAG: hypothetical protein MUE72_09840 [Chitinophagaceae bacterium]|nr:hypothetical protein [Chitinophagaceae bacterium]
MATEKNTNELLVEPSPVFNGLAMKVNNTKSSSTAPVETHITNGLATNNHKKAVSVAPKKDKTVKAVVPEIQPKKQAKKKDVVVKEPQQKVKAAASKKSVTSTKQTAKKLAAVENVGSIITFQLKFRTNYGQIIFITGNHPQLGNGNIEEAIAMQYLNEDFWQLTVAFSNEGEPFSYNYFVKNADGTVSYDWGKDKQIDPSTTSGEILILDSWNYAGYYENAFYSFQDVRTMTIGGSLMLG